jgi:hypothetical protein
MLTLNKLAIFGAGVSGIVLVMAGFAARGRDFSGLAAIVGQAGTPNQRLVEKTRLIPPLLSMTGGQLVLISAAALGLRSRRRTGAAGTVRLKFSQRWLLFLLTAYSLIAILTFNFAVLSLFHRLNRQSGRTDAEIVSADFGEDDQIVELVRSTTPTSAAILIKTQRPLQFLLNYELYPRRFYFYPDREMPADQVPTAWLDHHQIGWILEISDSGPPEFRLTPRKVSF